MKELWPAWTLNECVEHTLAAIQEQDREYVMGDPPDLHHTLGRWIRNNCELWTHGTSRCVADIVREYKAGRLKSRYLEMNEFVHPELPFDIMNAKAVPPLDAFVLNDNKPRPKKQYPDRELAHPDNCSAVILEVVIQRLKDEHGR